MKKTVMFVLATCLLMACSSDNDNTQSTPLYDNFVVDEQYTTTQENGLTICRDESGRVTTIDVLQAWQDDYNFLETLKKAPTSFEDISYLFPLSEGNEIRLTSTSENPALKEYPDYPQYFEYYSQYYKDVHVVGYAKRIHYFLMPEGKRMSYAIFGPVIDVRNLDTKPGITEKQARQVMADYLKVKRDDSWPCQLQIKEYSTRKDGKIQRDVRLIYSIEGPLAPTDPNVYYYMAPQYHAAIDAHTGQLITISS